MRDGEKEAREITLMLRRSALARFAQRKRYRDIPGDSKPFNARVDSAVALLRRLRIYFFLLLLRRKRENAGRRKTKLQYIDDASRVE